MKIAILGHSGAGKSTLARQLGELYNLPVLHLDTVNFLPNWQERPKEESQQIVQEFMQQDNWIIEGNYSSFYQKERVAQADTIIFLLFNRFTCYHRVRKRAKMFEGTSRPDMADGCAEKLDWEFTKWVLYKGRTKKRKKHYKNIATQYSTKTIVLKNAKQVKKYLENLNNAKLI